MRAFRKAMMAVQVTAITAFAVLSLAGCKHAAQAYESIRVEETTTPTPLRVGHSQLTLRITRRDGTPLEGATIQVEADMTHAGMAPVFSNAVEKGAGRYQAPLELNMAGDWVLLLHVHAADGATVERQLNLRGVNPK